MTRQEAVTTARQIFGQRIIAQGSEYGTGYANRCYLMRRIVTRTTRLEPIGIGRTWWDALEDARLTTALKKETYP